MSTANEEAVFTFIEAIRNTLPDDLSTLQQIEGMALAARSLVVAVSPHLDESLLDATSLACDHLLDGFATPIPLASSPNQPRETSPFTDSETLSDRRSRYAVWLMERAFAYQLDWLVAIQALGIAAKFLTASTCQLDPLTPNTVLALQALATGFALPVKATSSSRSHIMH